MSPSSLKNDCPSRNSHSSNLFLPRMCPAQTPPIPKTLRTVSTRPGAYGDEAWPQPGAQPRAQPGAQPRTEPGTKPTTGPGAYRSTRRSLVQAPSRPAIRSDLSSQLLNNVSIQNVPFSPRTFTIVRKSSSLWVNRIPLLIVPLPSSPLPLNSYVPQNNQ